MRDAALFEAVVKQAFATRRKMLRGALSAQFGDDAVAAAFAASGIAGTKRAEQLRSPTSRGSRTRLPKRAGRE